MQRRGFTLIEVMLAVAIIALLGAMAFKRVRTGLDKANVRSARVFLSTKVALTRSASVQRSCRAVLHMQNSAPGNVWVTACPRTQAGAGTVDTLGAVGKLTNRYKVSLTSTLDSIQYDPRGVNMNASTIVIQLTGATSDGRDSLVVNPLGLVMR